MQLFRSIARSRALRLVGALLLSIAAACAHELPKPLAAAFEHADLSERDAVTFAVLGDTGTGELTQYQVAEALREVCGREDCDFVLVTGDNVYPSGIDAIDDPQLEAKFERPYAGLGELDFWLVPGNHDWKGSVQAQIDYTAVSRRWRMPASHYALPSLPEWLHIYGLDTETLTPEQVSAAEEALCDRDGVRLAFGHHPLFSNGDHGGSAEVRTDLGPLFEKCGVEAYFSGHDHHQELIEAGELLQVVQGAGASVRSVSEPDAASSQGRQLFAAAQPGFTIVRVTEDALEMSFYDAEAELLFEYER